MAPEAEAIKMIVDWMLQHSYATGHGDSVADLLAELEWQAKERGNRKDEERINGD